VIHTLLGLNFMHTHDFWPPGQATAVMHHVELQSQVGEIRVSTEFSHHSFVYVDEVLPC
jgi:hypothetical protein